jgi:hypothetical protein
MFSEISHITKNTLNTQNMSAIPSKTTIVGTLDVDVVRIANYTLAEADGSLMVEHTDGGTTILGQPLINAETSFSTCYINYTSLLPSAMLASITQAGGGINRYWGQSASYIADTDLLAGRLVSLADQTEGTDNTNGLLIGYLKIGSSVVAAVTPIGVTQHNCLAGQSILVCIHGFTTAISLSTIAHARRGSVVLAADADIDNGKVRIGVAGAAGQARIGYVAQSNAVVANMPVLIHYDGYFQPIS